MELFYKSYGMDHNTNLRYLFAQCKRKAIYRQYLTVNSLFIFIQILKEKEVQMK